MCCAFITLTSYVFYCPASRVRKFFHVSSLEHPLCRPEGRVPEIPMDPLETHLRVQGEGHVRGEPIIYEQVVGEVKQIFFLATADVAPFQASAEVILHHEAHRQELWDVVGDQKKIYVDQKLVVLLGDLDGCCANGCPFPPRSLVPIPCTSYTISIVNQTGCSTPCIAQSS